MAPKLRTSVDTTNFLHPTLSVECFPEVELVLSPASVEPVSRPIPSQYFVTVSKTSGGLGVL
jgi:hypothetical protein